MFPSLVLLRTTRPSFLLLAPICVFLGLSFASYDGAQVEPFVSIVITVGAVCAHASVNAFNEYFDFRSGLDLQTCRTPFSGGSGTLPAHPHLAGSTLALAWTLFLITVFAGAWLSWRSGFWLLPMGLSGLALIYFYSGPINRSPWGCLFAPGLGFGPLMVIGSSYAATGQFVVGSMAASIVPMLLVSNLLLLNQFPDRDADCRVGRRHVVVTLGLRQSAKIYVLLLVSAYLWLLAAAGFAILPVASLLGLFTLPLAALAGNRVIRYSSEPMKLLPAMGLNVLLNLLTPLLMGIGVMTSS